MKKNVKRSSVVQFMKSREINAEICGLVQERLHVTDRLIDRLGLEVELNGHEGCVNCLEWSENGNYLASGSDDLNVILWDPLRKKLLYKYPTLHQNNIFSVKFLPRTNDTKIVTGSADYQVLALDAVTKETFFVCTCANARIKRIATAPDSPDVFWSAAEDGFIRQNDLRSPHTCDNGAAQNLVINLKNHQGALAEGKCIAINPLRTEMLAVGSNDPFIRLYDRRMIKLTTDLESMEWYRRMLEGYVPDSTCTETDLEVPWNTTDNLIKGCVQYFVPGHLQAGNGYKVSKHTAITYLSFSPDGRELLANLGNEQIYLFDVTKKHVIRSFSVPNTVDIPQRETDETVIHTSSSPSCDVRSSRSMADHHQEILPELINKLRLEANELFKNKKYHRAIRVYNEAIAKYSGSAVLYGNRAAAYMKRAWKGDLYAAVRDCRTALQLDPDHMKAFFRLARCFHELKRNKEAKDCLNQFKMRFSNQADNPHCRALEKDIEIAYKKRQNDTARKNAKSGSRTDGSVIVSLHLDGFYVADTNLELQISNPEKLWRDKAFDFEHRYCGHCNATTDIKEANFFGRDGRYIVAGSDDGSIFFWDRYSENNIRVLKGDSSIVNCLQPHPSYCLLASSGIDPVVRLWSPMPEENWDNECIVQDLEQVAEKNHERMKRGFLDVVLAGHSGTSSDDSSQMDEPSSYPCRPS